MCTTDSTPDPKRLSLADKVTNSAAGSPAGMAAAIIVTEALGGRLVDQLALSGSGPDWAEVDWPATLDTTNYLSGGERRLIAVAGSFGSGVPVDLRDALSGLDATNGRLVLEAAAVAMGFGRPTRPGGER